jgi:hypothetical protein
MKDCNALAFNPSNAVYWTEGKTDQARPETRHHEKESQTTLDEGNYWFTRELFVGDDPARINEDAPAGWFEMPEDVEGKQRWSQAQEQSQIIYDRSYRIYEQLLAKITDGPFHIYPDLICEHAQNYAYDLASLIWCAYTHADHDLLSCHEDDLFKAREQINFLKHESYFDLPETASEQDKYFSGIAKEHARAARLFRDHLYTAELQILQDAIAEGCPLSAEQAEQIAAYQACELFLLAFKFYQNPDAMAPQGYFWATT